MFRSVPNYFPPPYYLNIIESGVKHHNPYSNYFCLFSFIILLFIEEYSFLHKQYPSNEFFKTLYGLLTAIHLFLPPWATLVQYINNKFLFFFIFFFYIKGGQKINVREYRRSNQKWTIQRNWQHRVHKTKRNNSKTQHKIIFLNLHFSKIYFWYLSIFLCFVIDILD
jgi:hypothetical protein